MNETNVDIDPALQYEQYSRQQEQAFIPQQFPASAVTTINGASGPNISFATGTGLTFSGVGSTITVAGTLVVGNGGTGATTAAGARANLGAAASGANNDINTFAALTGNGGFAAWTGTADGTTHATYSGTASVGYVQAELQGVMDKMKETTETLKKIIDALLASGVLEA